MINKKSLLSIYIATIVFTSCNPSVIKENDAKFLAACAGQPRWVANELYNYVIDTYEKSIREDDDELGDIVFEEGDDMWNLEVLNEKEDDYGDAITEWDLYNFIHDGEMPISNVDEYQAMQKSLVGAIFGFQGQMHKKTRAFKTANDVCGGNFIPLFEKICDNVEVFDFRKNEATSSKKVTVYDVVYRVNKKRYVFCAVRDMSDGTFEAKYINDAELFSDLGF